ncbi:lipopolysaccharide biosynthesis protein [Pedobacter duraquae]|uniref:O-antigen/teichoic acid export membrane protein n=1 Tax=Pedobacter duraquae TaxID=425511 RepID=A0A4R6IC19_9SPHI|nr:MATE family efflux transporter [Pedobacter duraquae]TDO19018.1 O-antigen/teichoic acid export membrane protein [Pedobacter duraquae]
MTKVDKKIGSRKAATIWNFFFLNIRFVVSMINGVLIIPLYLHYIDTAIYGAWLATGNILSWITIVDPGVGGVLLQKVGYAIGKEDKDDIGKVITSGTLISLALFIVCIAVGYITSFFIGGIANINVQYRSEVIDAFRIGVWGTAFSLLSNTFTNFVLAYQKTKLHGMFVNSIMGLSIIVTVVLLFNGFGIRALAYNMLFTGFSTLLYSVIMSVMLIKQNDIQLSFQLPYLKSFSKIFAYTFSSRLFDTIASNIDLVLVSRYLGPHFVTALDLSRRPVKIVTGLANNVSISMLPALSHLFGTDDKDRIRAITIRIWRIILWLSGLIIGGFVLFNHSFMINWVGKEFWIGTLNNNLLCISFFILSIGYNLSNITYSMGDIKNNSLINVVRNCLYLVLLYLLTKILGLTGVILAFTLPIFILIGYYPRKLFAKAEYTKSDIRSILLDTGVVSGILLCCVLITCFFPFVSSFVWLVVGAALFVIGYVSLLIILSSNFRVEIKYLQKFIPSKRLAPNV